MDKLPSRKLFFIVIPTIIIVAFVVHGYRNTKDSVESQGNLSIAANDALPRGEVDTDGDGLKDWEETLWGMDPKKIDSDNNGVTDNIEVAQMKQRGETPSAQQRIGTSSPLSRTDLLTQKLFGDYMGLKQQGNIASADLQTIASRSLSSLSGGKTANVYEMSDVRVATQATTQKSVLTFANNALVFFTELQSKKSILTSLVGIDIEAKEYRVNSLAISDIYTSLAKKLLTVEVPKEIAITYLSLINTYAKTGLEFQNVANGAEDPALAAQALQKIQSYALEQDTALTLINIFLEGYKITIENDGKGYRTN